MIKNNEVVKQTEGAEGDALTVYTVDLVPTIDQEVPVVSYINYNKADTKVITYSLGEGYPGIEVANVRSARKHCREVYGEILDEAFVPGRAFLRVRK